MRTETSAEFGSSPRVRGKRKPHYPRLGLRRLIPACAGKTPSRNCPRPSRRAHPRVCGENANLGRAGSRPTGSSPRVRGKPEGDRPRPRPRRLIPACAGKTRGMRRRRRCAAAHPRVCGENVSDDIRFNPGFGSSPRVRGKRRLREGRWSRGRLIPACAGKTLRTPTAAARTTAHPRVCGENMIGASPA